MAKHSKEDRTLKSRDDLSLLNQRQKSVNELVDPKTSELRSIELVDEITRIEEARKKG